MTISGSAALAVGDDRRTSHAQTSVNPTRRTTIRTETAVGAVGKVISTDLLLGALRRDDPVPIYLQVYEWFRDRILDGSLRQGASLPATRELASQIEVSRNTVLEAYNNLHAEGLIESRVGAGTIVSRQLPDERATSAGHPARPSVNALPAEPPHLSQRGRRLVGQAGSCTKAWNRPDTFHPGLAPVDLFPASTWRKLSDGRQALRVDVRFGYERSCGFKPLRIAIAEYLAATRGFRCQPNQVIVVSGVQDGLDLSTRVLLDEGDGVFVEDPCDPRVCNVFEAAGAAILPVPVDRHGFVVSAAVASSCEPRLAYVTPTHQFPLGYSMTASRRNELIQWAIQNEAWIVENHSDSEYWYSGRREAPLAALAADRVIHLGTFNNVLFPSLQIGYVVVPDALVDVFTSARALGDRHAPVFDQAVLTDFFADGHFARHLRRARVECAHRQDCLVDRISHETDGFVALQHSPAGMNMVGRLPAGVSDVQLSETLAASGIFAPPLSHFSAGAQHRNGLVLGYTGFSSPCLTRGAAAMGGVVRAFRSEHRTAAVAASSLIVADLDYEPHSAVALSAVH